MNFTTGEHVWWEDQLYLTGYTGAPVRAMFIKYREARVKNCGIAVQMRDGTWRPKWVSAERIKPRNGGRAWKALPAQLNHNHILTRSTYPIGKEAL